MQDFYHQQNHRKPKKSTRKQAKEKDIARALTAKHASLPSLGVLLTFLVLNPKPETVKKQGSRLVHY